ncbi:hypothetical protein EDD11_007867 [Mortierella claussenii]|nr:hypothetical protein EDD11_007867 [Mortierella claussenii]
MSVPRTPSRINKRTRYNVDKGPVPSFDLTTLRDGDKESSLSQEPAKSRGQDGEELQEDQEASAGQKTTMSGAAVVRNGESGESGERPEVTGPSIQSELEETRRLVKAFDAIDASMTETRDKLKTFYKTADETNTLLDMWIRVLSQTEHTQKLLQDPAWEGQYMESEIENPSVSFGLNQQQEEARDKEYQERKAAYQQAMEEASGTNNYNSSSSSLHHSQRRSQGMLHSHLVMPLTPNNPALSTFSASQSMAGSVSGSGVVAAAAGSASTAPGSSSSSSSPSTMAHTTTFGQRQQQHQHQPLRKSPLELVAAAHAHASAIAANRKRTAAGSTTTMNTTLTGGAAPSKAPYSSSTSVK